MNRNFSILCTLFFLSAFFLGDVHGQARVLEEDPDQGMNPSCGLPVYNDVGLIRQRAVWIGQFRWKVGQTIPVHFLSGTQEQMEATEHCAREWERFGNFQFSFHRGRKTTNELAIQIAFAPQKPGVLGWSYVGTGTTDPKQTSMSYADYYKGANACSTILHEFGHALGLHHEQHNPTKKDDWILDRTYAYFADKHKWSKEQVDENILMVKGPKYTNYTKADPVSTMAYYFPPDLFRSGKAMGIRFGLSHGDIEGIQKMYPGRPKPVDRRPILLYFKNSGLSFRAMARNGKLQVIVNGQVVDSVESVGPRNIQKVITADSLVSPKQLTPIMVRFEKTGDDFLYRLAVDEAGESLFAMQCDPTRICADFQEGFYLTHISNGNKGQHSAIGTVKIGSNTSTVVQSHSNTTTVSQSSPHTTPVSQTQPTTSTVTQSNPGFNSNTTTSNTTTTTSNTTTTVSNSNTTSTPTNVAKFDPEWSQRLISFAYEGKVQEANQALENGADPNYNYQGWTPLLYASYLGHKEVVLSLLRRNANITVAYQGWTPRMLALERGHSEIVDMLDAYTGFRGERDYKKPRSLPKLD